RTVRQDRIDIGVYLHAGAFYAYRNHCLHQGGPACEGVVKSKVVELLAPDKSYIGRPTTTMIPTSCAPGTAGNTSCSPANVHPIRALSSSAMRLCSAREASMSSSDVLDRPADALGHASDALAAALADPDRVPDAALRALIANALRLYAVKAEAGMRTPLPVDC